MGLDTHPQVQVARGGVTTALAALARQPDALPVGDTWRHVDLIPPRLPGGTGERDGATAAPVRLLDGERQFGLLVRSGDATSGGSQAEHGAEQVLDVDALRAEVVAEAGGVPDTWASRARGPPAAEAAARSGRDPFVEVLGDLAEILAEAVVTGPGLRVRQDAVCLVEVLETLLRPRVLVDVGVVPAGKLAICLLDLVLARAPRHAQHLVEIPCHRRSLPLRDGHRGLA